MFLILPFFLLLAALPAIVMIVNACTLPRWARDRGLCGKCGYNSGLIPICPECGSDILTVGLISPRAALRFRVSCWVAILAWLWLMLSVSWIGFTIVEIYSFQRAATQSIDSASLQLSPSEGSQSVEAGSYRLHTCRITTSGPSGSSSQVLVMPDGTASAAPGASGSNADRAFDGFAHARIDGTNWKYEIIDKGGKTIDSGPEFDYAASRRMHDAAGLDPDSRAIAAAVHAAPQVVKYAASGAFTNQSHGTFEFTTPFVVSTSFTLTSPIRSGLNGWGLLAMYWTLAIGITFAGAIGIWLRRRALFRRAESPLPKSTPVAG